MTKPFIIYALPRSRTLWLSKFLTYGKWECKHDLLAEYIAIPPIVEYLKQPYRGIIDTGLVVARMQMPEAKIVCIHRKPQEVKDSLAAIGLPGLIDVDLLDSKLEELRGVKGVRHYNYEDLNDLATCADIAQFCTGQFSVQWWRCLCNANIQIDISKGPPHGQFQINS